MSIVEPEKLIILISDLEDFLSSWNVMASDALSLTEKMRAECMEVCNLAEKDKNRSMETERTDGEILKKAKEQTDSLYKKSNELKQQTSPFPDQAENRVQKWKHSCEQSDRYIQGAEEWLNTAIEELQRAQYELDEAERDYRYQVNLYHAAVDRLNSTPPMYEVTRTDLKGQEYKEMGPNPEYESARGDKVAQENELRRRKIILDDKRRVHEFAQEQKGQAKEACSIAEAMQKESERFLKEALVLKEWAYDAEKYASYALSAIESASRLNEEAEAKCKKQSAIIEEIIRQYEKIKSCQEEILYFSQNISEQTNSCNNIITRFAMVLNNKKTLLHRLSAILPDKIAPFII